MLQRRIGYSLMVAFAIMLLARLMLDDPEAQRNRAVSAGATQQAVRPREMFPEVQDPAQVYRIEVLDVTKDTLILLLRDEAGLWYAPEIPGSQVEIGPQQFDQQAAENAALAISLMGAQQWFDATPERMALFGLSPVQFLFDFRAYANQTPSGGIYTAGRIVIGDTNPDHMAYYVWPEGDQQIYLVPSLLVDPLLTMFTESLAITPTPDGVPMDAEVTSSEP